jgi:hypothetical protein
MDARSLVILTLVLGVAAIAVYVLASISTNKEPRSPPGQYPLDATRPQWPVKEATKAYAPSKSMGSDAVVSTEPKPAKAVCAESDECYNSLQLQY